MKPKPIEVKPKKITMQNFKKKIKKKHQLKKKLSKPEQTS